MRRLIHAAATILLSTTGVWAQEGVTLYTRPVVPSREALDRLHLKMAWRVYLPMEGKQDGLFSVQVPERAFTKITAKGRVPAQQVLVQTKSGAVVALDPDTGEVQWRARVGNPYQVSQRLAYNSRSVFAAVGNFLYALDRRTGELQWQAPLPSAPAAPPVADEYQVYLCLGTGRLFNYQLPDLDLLKNIGGATGKPADPFQGEKLPPNYTGGGYGLYSLGSGQSARDLYPPVSYGPQPLLLWDMASDVRVDRTPLLTADFWLLPGANGTVFVVSKQAPKELFRVKTGGPIPFAPGQSGEMAYVASQDETLYAIKITSGETLWTYTTGTPVLQKPEVTDEDVYVVTKRAGLQRLVRATGERAWRQPAAAVTRFLAANPKFVYAADSAGRLLVLDRARGTRLSEFDSRDFVVPVANDLTDRLFLAAHDGLLVCLHDRDYEDPVYHRKPDQSDGGKRNPLYGKLSDVVSLEKGLDKMPLADALAVLEKKFRLPIVVSEKDFKAAGVDNILAKTVSLPKVDAAPLGELLNQLLKPINAAYSVRADYVLIIPVAPKAPEGGR